MLEQSGSPDNTGSLQVTKREDDGRFKKGCSGNPKGRPYGVRNKISFAIQQIFEEEAFTVAHKVVELAKNGDISAIKLILERVYPAPKNNELRFLLPEIKDRNGIDKARDEIQKSFVDGEITTAEAKEALVFLDVASNANKKGFDFFD
jgi:hypothetical protein